MTNRELIELLEAMPLELEVALYTGDDGGYREPNPKICETSWMIKADLQISNKKIIIL